MPVRREPEPKSPDDRASGVDGPRATLSHQERRTIFAHMVRTELERGVLGSGRRREMVRFAQDIGIRPDQAERMIEDARYNLGLDDPFRHKVGTGVDTSVRLPDVWGWVRFSLLGGMILLVEWLLVQSLLH